VGFDIFVGYDLIGLVIAVWAGFSGKLGEASIFGPGAGFVNVWWAWPLFLVSCAFEYRKKRKGE
jgi:hypothetical protein